MGFVSVAAGHSRAKHQKTVLDLLRERHAVKRETAQPLPNLSSSQRRRVERLIDRGVVRVAAKDRYYIDEHALRDWVARNRAIAFAIVVVAAGVGAAWFLMP
jgi:proteasome lid subunit RPN8/RPN11